MNRSLRRYLLAGIIVPVVLFVIVDTVSLYRSALASINTAYDRSLLASARTIGELLKLQGAQLRVDVPYTASLNPSTPFTLELWAKPNSAPTDLFAPVASLDANQNSAASREGASQSRPGRICFEGLLEASDGEVAAVDSL